MLEDEKSSKRVPAVSGLLAYRKDMQSLHVRMNDSWKTLLEEEKIHQIVCIVTHFFQNLLAQYNRCRDLLGISVQ